MEIISRIKARIILFCASGNKVLGSFVPIPVSVTTPIIIPTHEAAAISETPPCAAFSNARTIARGPTRVVGLNAPTMSTKSRAILTARKGVYPKMRNTISVIKATRNTRPRNLGGRSGASRSLADAPMRLA